MIVDCYHTVDHYHHTQKELAQLRQLIETRAATIDKLTAAWCDHQIYHEDHPLLLWLVRFRTKQIVETIILIFVLLSLLCVFGFRQPLLRWPGFPPNDERILS